MEQTARSVRDDIGDDVVLKELALIHDSIERLRGASLWSRSDGAARDGVKTIYATVASLQSASLDLVRDLDERPSAVAGARKGHTAMTFLKTKVLRTHGQAHGDVRDAHRFAADADPATGGMPRLGEAFAQGRVSREHVAVAARTRNYIPEHYYSTVIPDPNHPEHSDEPAPLVTGGEAIDRLLSEKFPNFNTTDAQKLAQRLIAAIDPDGKNSFDPKAHARRSVTTSRDASGMVHGRFALGPVEGEELLTALDHFSAPQPSRDETAEDGTTVAVTDDRSGPQRRADALGQICSLAMSAGESGTRGGEPPRIVIHANPEQVADLLHDNPPTDNPLSDNPLSDADPSQEPEAVQRGERLGSGQSFEPGQSFRPDHSLRPNRRGHCAETGLGGIVGDRLLGRFLCDSILEAVLTNESGAVLSLGRSVRLATPAQRRALVARDQGCIIPGCGNPASWTECHHVTFWSRGGPTDVDAMCLLCPRHHTEVHLGMWVIEMRDGVPWVQLPAWLDARQPWVRNTYNDDCEQARHLGAQLRLDIPPERPG
jgi:hypothetical protein